MVAKEGRGNEVYVEELLKVIIHNYFIYEQNHIKNV